RSPGATFATLEVMVDGPAEAGLYSLRAVNAAGEAVSQGAYLEVWEPAAAGPLFSTGVDANGWGIDLEADDPHYTLIENADGLSDIPAVVESNVPGAWMPNTEFSQWIGPWPDTSQSAVGRYVYRTVVDAGPNPDAFAASGFWAVDN